MDYTNQQLATMPIAQVVKLLGGNGLASPAFQAPSNFMGVFRWEHVEEGAEALVVDGERVQRTRFASDWWRLAGRHKFMRRVMLRPAPLTDISAKALTADKDKRELSLTVTVKYEVIDPAHVATLQDPILELTSLIVGVLAEYVRSETLETLVSDNGKLRLDLRKALEAAPSIQGWYAITEVLKAVPSGDERIIEIARQTHLAKASRELVELEGQNKVTKATFEQQIAAEQAELKDKIDARQHERDMEKRQLDAKAGAVQEALKALGEVGKGGIDPAKTAVVLIDLVAPRVERPTEAFLASPLKRGALESGTDSHKEAERAALESIRESTGMLSFEVFEKDGQFRGVIVHMPNYEIVLTCPDGYPKQAPEVNVNHASGNTFQPVVPWISGVSNLLAQVVLAVIPQVKVQSNDSTQ